MFDVQRLAHVHDINGFFKIVLVEFHHRQRDILGRVKRGSVRTQDDNHPILFPGTQDFVQVNHDWQIGASVFRQAGFNQLFHGGFTRFFHFALKIDAVKVFPQQGVNLLETFQRPVAGLFPQRQDVWVARVPTGKIRAHFGFKAFLKGKAAVRFRKEVPHPTSFILARLFSRVIFFVIAQPLDDVQPDIPQVIRANHALTAGFQNITGGTTQDNVAQMPDVQGFVGVRVGIFHHHWSALGFPAAVLTAGSKHVLNYLAGIVT